MPKLLVRYKNGNLITSLYSDGTRERITNDDEFHPAFAENVDVQVSNRCDHGCPMCYANCTADGAFGKLDGWEFIDSFHPGTEMAVNLNFPMAPDFTSFLRTIKGKGVFLNITVNQDHFMEHEDVIRQLYEEELVYGIGISLTNPSKEFIWKVKKYPNAVIHVINGILTKEQCDLLADNGLKILILGFKDIGRGFQYHKNEKLSVNLNQQWLYDALPEITEKFSVVSFDNLAIEQLNVRRLLTDKEWDEFYGGDDGQFTFFINLVEGYFARNSLSSVHYPIEDKTMDEMFGIIRNGQVL